MRTYCSRSFTGLGTVSGNKGKQSMIYPPDPRHPLVTSGLDKVHILCTWTAQVNILQSSPMSSFAWMLHKELFQMQAQGFISGQSVKKYCAVREQAIIWALVETFQCPRAERRWRIVPAISLPVPQSTEFQKIFGSRLHISVFQPQTTLYLKCCFYHVTTSDLKKEILSLNREMACVQFVLSVFYLTEYSCSDDVWPHTVYMKEPYQTGRWQTCIKSTLLTSLGGWQNRSHFCRQCHTPSMRDQTHNLDWDGWHWVEMTLPVKTSRYVS